MAPLCACKGTAERYVLGEMADVERDEYEAHFFSCEACADDVRAAAAFLANARSQLAFGAVAVNRRSLAVEGTAATAGSTPDVPSSPRWPKA